MTTPTMALTELAEKGADVDVLRQMVQFIAQRLMELDVEGLWRAKFPKIAALMDSAEHEVLAYMTFPKAHCCRSTAQIRSRG